jgi:hypothetical protein
MYVGLPMTTMLVEAVLLGIAILQDKREHPVFLR